MGKTALFGRVNQISDDLNITRDLVHRILLGYLGTVRNRVLEGNAFTFLGIVDVVPDIQVCEYRETQAYMLQEVAKESGATYVTVNSVIASFFDSLWRDLKNGKPVTFNGICTVTPMRGIDGATCKVWTRTSAVLIRDMRERGNGVRCKTSAYLRKWVEDTNSNSSVEVEVADSSVLSEVITIGVPEEVSAL